VIRLFLADIDGCLSEPYRPFDLAGFARLRAWAIRAEEDDRCGTGVCICGSRLAGARPRGSCAVRERRRPVRSPGRVYRVEPRAHGCDGAGAGSHAGVLPARDRRQRPRHLARLRQAGAGGHR